MPTTDEPERRFAVGQTLRADRPRTVLDVRFGQPLLILFEGCPNREAAEALRGTWLLTDIEGSPEDPDEFYDHQLLGLHVLCDGDALGTVVDVLHLPGQDLLEVDLGTHKVLVPFVQDIVPVIDIEAGQIHVRRVEGLFDDAL